MGKLSANEKSFDSHFLFATVQSLGKNLHQFEKNHFDYIIVDEFHHAAADTYKNILAYFQSKFLLGLTATPERMDGKDIMALCDYNIAGEVRIREALEQELLELVEMFRHMRRYAFVLLEGLGFHPENVPSHLFITTATSDHLVYTQTIPLIVRQYL